MFTLRMLDFLEVDFWTIRRRPACTYKVIAAIRVWNSGVQIPILESAQPKDAFVVRNIKRIPHFLPVVQVTDEFGEFDIIQDHRALPLLDEIRVGLIGFSITSLHCLISSDVTGLVVCCLSNAKRKAAEVQSL